MELSRIANCGASLVLNTLSATNQHCTSYTRKIFPAESSFAVSCGCENAHAHTLIMDKRMSEDLLVLPYNTTRLCMPRADSKPKTTKSKTKSTFSCTNVHLLDTNFQANSLWHDSTMNSPVDALDFFSFPVFVRAFSFFSKVNVTPFCAFQVKPDEL